MTSAKIRRFPFRVNPLPGKSRKKNRSAWTSYQKLGRLATAGRASPRRDRRIPSVIDFLEPVGQAGIGPLRSRRGSEKLTRSIAARAVAVRLTVVGRTDNICQS